jgi:amidase
VGDPYCAPPQVESYLQAIARSPKKLRIAFALKDFYGRDMHTECTQAVMDAAKLCEDLGHVVEEASPDIDHPAISQAFGAIWGAGHALLIREAARARGREPRQEDLQGLVWATYRSGLQVSGIQYLEAWATLHAQSRRIAAWHSDYDVWLTPTLNAPPWKIGQFDTSTTDVQAGFRPMAVYVPFTGLQNMTGQPAINVPLHWTPEGLPVGVQFVGRFGDDDIILRLAAQIEQAKPWMTKRPPVGD